MNSDQAIGQSEENDGAALALGLEWCRPISNREAKERIALKVAGRASSGEVIGIGSGSTSFLTALALGKRVADENLKVMVVPTSVEIELACSAVGLNVCSDAPMQIDFCFDGADEVDTSGRLIKGRGGALYRERLVFAAAVKRLVVADASKSVDRLGCNFPVPLEVELSWIRSAHKRIGELDHVTDVALRMGVNKDGPVITESGRLLLDVTMSQIDEKDEALLLSVPGVCCTGIFSGFDFERISE